MDQIRSYLLSVTAVCMISAICLQMVQLPKIKGILRFVTGILVLLVVASIAPKAEELLQQADLSNWEFGVNKASLEENVQTQLAKHVVSTTEQYIEQKAAELGATIQARVQVSEEEYPVPYAVTVIGTLSPKQKTDLAEYLCYSLNIPYERQEWK